MDPAALYPTCVLKVNIGCCKACLANLKTLLSKIDGVHAVEIVDPKEGIVRVSGEADPHILVAKIRKKKKNAEILSYQDPINNTRNQNHPKKEPKITQSDPKEKEKNGKKKEKQPDDHEFGDYVPKKKKCKDPYCKLHQQGNVIKSNKVCEPPPPPPPPPRNFQLPPGGWAFPTPTNPFYYGCYPPQVPSGYYQQDCPANRWRVHCPQPSMFGRQVPPPQFDPYFSQRPPRQEAYGPYGGWA